MPPRLFDRVYEKGQKGLFEQLIKKQPFILKIRINLISKSLNIHE